MQDTCFYSQSYRKQGSPSTGWTHEPFPGRASWPGGWWYQKRSSHRTLEGAGRWASWRETASRTGWSGPGRTPCTVSGTRCNSRPLRRVRRKSCILGTPFPLSHQIFPTHRCSCIDPPLFRYSHRKSLGLQDNLGWPMVQTRASSFARRKGKDTHQRCTNS